MIQAGEHILLVNYDFPPNNGIGGRRWAKFARELASRGYVLHVIKADPVPGEDQSPWTDDVKHPNIHVVSLPRKYPQKFSHPGSGLFDKIAWRMHKKRLEKKESGTIYDISIGWEEILLPACEELVKKHQIKWLIATGAPWKMLYDVSRLRFSIPSLQLLIDYRDPWLNAANYGMPGLDFSRRKEEERKQSYVLENAAVITSPYHYLTEELRTWSERHCKHRARFEVLTHFYDPVDLPAESNESRNDDKIRIVYGGDLYIGTDQVLQTIKQDLLKIQAESPALYHKLDIRIYTNKHETKAFDGISCVKVFPGIGKKIFQEIQDADACMIILPPNKKNDCTTKFFEYLPMRKPLIVYADEGEVTRFVRQEKLGYVVDKEGLMPIAENILNGNKTFNEAYNYEQHSLPRITEKLITLLR